MTCRWTSSDRPRTLPGRHRVDCADEMCAGCQPCTEPHCRICARTHAEGACAECLAEVRANLREIGRLCDALPDEVEHRGVEGEAMMLLGPAADPEAWGHREASAKAGRVSADYLADARDEQHPLWVLGTWDMVWRDALEHDDGSPELPVMVDYLDRTMGYMAGYALVPFEDFARDLRTCRAHLEAVLHDGEQRDVGAPCMTCGATLEQPTASERPCRHSTAAREWVAVLETYPEVPIWNQERTAAKAACGDCDQGGRQDGWRCPRCRQTSTEDQYRFAVAHVHREEATHLTDRDMELRTGVKAGTVRSWATKGHLVRTRDSGRTLYAVNDVMRLARERGLIGA